MALAFGKLFYFQIHMHMHMLDMTHFIFVMSTDRVKWMGLL